jgi:hypothetical protein
MMKVEKKSDEKERMKKKDGKGGEEKSFKKQLKHFN